MIRTKILNKTMISIKYCTKQNHQFLNPRKIPHINLGTLGREILVPGHLDRDFMFSRFETKQRNCGIKYSRKIRNLQYIPDTKRQHRLACV